jgi:hypothetical protein
MGITENLYSTILASSIVKAAASDRCFPFIESRMPISCRKVSPGLKRDGARAEGKDKH